MLAAMIPNFLVICVYFSNRQHTLRPAIEFSGFFEKLDGRPSQNGDFFEKISIAEPKTGWPGKTEKRAIEIPNHLPQRTWPLLVLTRSRMYNFPVMSPCFYLLCILFTFALKSAALFSVCTARLFFMRDQAIPNLQECD
jgi:hypothetical protein